jgi:hypothetical protein
MGSLFLCYTLTPTVELEQKRFFLVEFVVVVK